MGLCFALQATGSLDASGVWTAIVLGHATRCVLSIWRFQQGSGRPSRWSEAQSVDRCRAAGCLPTCTAAQPSGGSDHEMDTLGIAATSRTCAADRAGMAMGAGGLGVGGLLLLLVLSWATGIDLTSIAGGGGSAPPDVGRHLRRASRPRPKKSGSSTWSTRSWTTRRTRGGSCSAGGTRTPRRCCSATRSTPPAASRRRRPGRSTVRPIGRSISISASSTSCSASSARPATSRRPTCSPTSSAITCRP